ncbi:MAG: PKD domain-containing protein [Verrucomicrobiota bacterium]
MKLLSLALTVSILLALAPVSPAAVRYVDAGNSQPVPPYTNWAGAAATIQDAVDAAETGDEVVATNGWYALGGRAVQGTLTNRLAIDRAITVRSVNGPEVTVIAGSPSPSERPGDGAVRCAYVGTGAVLSGFTLTNGFTRWSGDPVAEESGGGAWCETGAVVTNCAITGNWAATEGGGASGGTLLNCTLADNLAITGGGAASSTLFNCILKDNVASCGGAAAKATLHDCALNDNYAEEGGGAWNSALFDCTLSRNRAGDGADLEAGTGGGATGSTLCNCTLTGNGAFLWGGGADSCTLSNCTLSANSAETAGGACNSTLYNSLLRANYAEGGAGGTYAGTLYNCALIENSARDAGGADQGTFYNCTLTRNSATHSGGGTRGGTLYNCIVYFNTAQVEPNYSESTFNYSCATPLPPAGAGNVAADPRLASSIHLSADSPCIGAGNPVYSRGTDIDGQNWQDPPCMGAEQYVVGGATGTLAVAIGIDYTNVATGFAVSLSARIEGAASASCWDFGDGTVVSNLLCASHAWTQPGSYAVRLTAWNESWPAGVTATTAVAVVERPVYYVNRASTAPAFPYNSWATAARTIQDAIAAGTAAGRLVRVADGLYDDSGAAGDGTNRVALTDPVMVQSMNGPAATSIAGAEAPTGGNAPHAIRCAYVANGAVLSGFTLTNGHSGYRGGGAWCEPGGVVTNCVMVGNGAFLEGGGAAGGTLYSCTLTGNSATNYGGGASGSLLCNCVLTGNSVSYQGGGANGGALFNCAVNGNSANYGGGAANSRLFNCTLTGNSASEGGGAYETALYHCTVTGNTATESSRHYYNAGGGGVNRCTLNNCIVYFNIAGVNIAGAAPNYAGYTIFNYSCTTPLPEMGTGNITSDPLLASPAHLAAGSPCIGAGSPLWNTGVDIDGEAWGNPPCMGADQYAAGAATGPLTVAMTASCTNVAPGFAVSFDARIDGRATASAWDFDDGTVVSNRPYASHAWSQPGLRSVQLRAWNESNPAGVTATLVVEVTGTMYFADQANLTPVFPYTNWQTAAQSIQDAIEAAMAAGATVVVADGVYTTGGKAAFGTLTNRVCIDKSLIVRSLHGPGVTAIAGAESPGGGNGDGAIRCAYVGNRAILSGFTLVNGHTRTNGDWSQEQSGGGVWCDEEGAVTNCVLNANSAGANGGGALVGTLYNCTVTGNSAVSYGGGVYADSWRATPALLYNCTITGNSAWSGAGVYEGTLYNCLLSGNSAIGAEYWQGIGGGAYSSTLLNCTVTGNSATHRAGGIYMGALTNCVVYYNTAPDSPNWAGYNFNYLPPFHYSCTTPAPTGMGNITSEPAFVDPAGGNLRLRSNSPCINAGSNAGVDDPTDLDGQPRIAGGTVDMGAYEFQAPASLISYAWLQQYGLPTDGSADFIDSDGDGASNWLEWRFGTDPTDPRSVLRLLATTVSSGGVSVSWQSVTNRSYILERASDLRAQPAFLPVADGIAGQPGSTSFTDTSAFGPGPFFYRVGVQ